MSQKTIYILSSVAIIFIISLLILSKKGVFGDKNKGKEVEIAEVNEITIVEIVSATGKIQSEIEIKISSEVSGEIIELPIKEGQAVKKGDLLVRVNPDLYQSGLNRSMSSLSNSKASLSQADAQLKESKANYDRNRTLFDKGIISKSEWDKIVSNYEVATAAKQASYFNVQSASATVNEAEENLRRTTIYAPIEGTISKLDAKLGERVVGTQQMTGTEILRVANLNNMEVEVNVNENDIVKVHLGNEAIVAVDAYLKKQFKGIVTSISNSANSDLKADQVTNFKVKIRIVKESYEDLIREKPIHYSPFRPGMTATVDIMTKKKEKVLSVPISAVVVKSDTVSVVVRDTIPVTDKIKKEQKFECVFVKERDKAKLRIIKTGIQDDINIEVIEGLKKGDLVIIGPYTTVTKGLNPNDRVSVRGEKHKN